MRYIPFSQVVSKLITSLVLNLALIFFALPATAQREYHQWVSGMSYDFLGLGDYSLGILDFSTRPARLPYRLPTTPDLPGFLEPRTSATISTPCGELLYLSNGHKVLDAAGHLLPNGDRLDSARTVRNDTVLQCPYSALFVPVPSSTTQTLLFSATRTCSIYDPTIYPQFRPTPVLRYSLIERASDGSGARVTRRAVPLSTVGVAGVGATRHANHRDTWVMARTLRGGKFLAYRVTPRGVTATPVVSPSRFNPDTLGGVTFSPDGRWVLFSTRFDSVNSAMMTHLRWLALARFDAATGRVSEERIVSYNAFEGGFSADSRFIYVQNYGSNVANDVWRNIEQVALDPIAGAVVYSGVIISQDPQMILLQSGVSYGSNLQNYVALAPNGAILLATKRSTNSSATYPSWFPVIRRPTLPDTACQFRVLGISDDFFGGTGFSSVNTAAMLDSVAEIRHLSTCETDTVELWLANPGCARGVRWNFGDPAGGPAHDTATVWAPRHRFSSPGTYTVTATLADGRVFRKAVVYEPVGTTTAAAPNIFTPNADGLNDTFRPVATSGPVLHWAIYNRWGKRVWQTTDPAALWTGADCSEGVYYYLFTTTDCTGAPVERRGIVTLVR